MLSLNYKPMMFTFMRVSLIIIRILSRRIDLKPYWLAKLAYLPHCQFSPLPLAEHTSPTYILTRKGENKRERKTDRDRKKEQKTKVCSSIAL